VIGQKKIISFSLNVGKDHRRPCMKTRTQRDTTSKDDCECMTESWSSQHNTMAFERLCSSDDYDSSFDARKKQAAAQLPAPLTEAIVRNARAELSQGEWGLLEQCIACYTSQRMSTADLLSCAKTMAPRSMTLAEVFGKSAAPQPIELLDDEASADDMASLLVLSRASTTEDLGEEASLDDMAELMAMSGMSTLLPAPAEPEPTAKPLKTQRPPADTMCRLTEQRELLERYNQLVHFGQWIEKQMVFSDDTEEHLDDIPAMSALPATSEPAPTTNTLSKQSPPADTLRQCMEQRELLERYNRLVHLGQLMESKIQELRFDRRIQSQMQEAQMQMTSSHDTEDPMTMSDVPIMFDSAQPTLKCKTPPRSGTQQSRLSTIYEEEPVPVVPLRILAPAKAPEMQRPTPIQLLRQSKKMRAKQDNQGHQNDNKGMGVLAELIELKKQLQTKMSVADEKESGQYYKGHVTLKNLATQAKGEDAILSLSDGNLSLVGGAELDQTLLSMSFSHVLLGTVPGHDNCIHFKTTKKKEKTDGVIIVLPSRSIRDEWLAASSSMDIKIEKW